MAIVDFTNPEACKWYVGLIHTLMDTGVDTIKTDFGERIPHLDVVYHDGSDPRQVSLMYGFDISLILQENAQVRLSLTI